MKKELLSITDENSILITAEFHKYGQRVKVGEVENQSYEIDLIVRNDITCSQLLEAIGLGIRHKLLNEYNYDVDSEPDTVDMLYGDSRHPEAETAEAGAADLLKNRYFKFLPWSKDKGKTPADGVLAESSVNESETAGAIDQDMEALSAQDKERMIYLICWKVFKECYKEYKQTSEEISELEKIKNGTPRKPVIGLSSIDYNSILLDTRMQHPLGESDRNQISLSLNPGWGMESLKKLGFITTTRIVFDPYGWHHSAALFDSGRVTEAFKERTPLYNISERPIKQLDNEPIHVLAPTDPPQKNKQNLLTAILAPLLMTGAMIAARMFSPAGSGTGSLIFMSMCMGAATLLVAVINVYVHNREYKENLKEWREHYQEYVSRLLSEIMQKQSQDIETLNELYPPARAHKADGSVDLIQKALEVNGDIFSRAQDHPDFLKARIGLSSGDSHLVPSVFEIKGEKKETIFASAVYRNIKNIPGYEFEISLLHEKKRRADGSTGYLIDLPSDISRQYSYLKKAPVLLSLKECGTLGIVFDENYKFQPFLSNLLLDLCFYQSPDDLQCVMFCDQTDDWIERQQIMRRYKHLPHFRELLGNLSAFAFDKGDAYCIFNKLLEIISARKDMDTGTKYPHILVIVLEEYDLKKHAISEYLPAMISDKDAEKYGISFIFCKRYTEELPKYCGQVIRRIVSDYSRRDGNEELLSEWFLLPHMQTISRDDNISELGRLPRYKFEPDQFPPAFKDMGNEDGNDLYLRAFKSVSALYYERIAQGSDVPASVELLDILGGSKAEEPEALAADLRQFIAESWGLNSDDWEKTGKVRDITASLAVPIGKKSDDENSGPILLDLHEKADGPHMLVAGTTGSGKTETILTFLVGLCAIYSPEQVNLLLMDMKGAGFVQRIGDDKTGHCLPHVVGTVTDISGDETGTGMVYMLKRFLQSMYAEVKRRKLLLKKMGADSADGYITARSDLKKHVKTHPKLKYEEIKDLEPLPHLFLVIDEFTELMRVSSDQGGIDFKTAITSLARIGRSLGIHIILISQNIENAITPDIRVNSRARLCLKVATRDASREMIGTDLAASPLMPGNGRAYLLVGTGSRFEYFQSGYSGADITRNLEQPIRITQAENSGEYTLFFDSETCTDRLSLSDDSASNEDKEESSHEDGKETRKRTGITQVQFMVDQITYCYKKSGIRAPHCVFQQPLPSACYYEYDWNSGGGRCEPIEEID